MDEVAGWLGGGGPAVVLAGAGVSTGSGIPDYRDASGAWKRSPPMQLGEFLGSERARQRYWARSLVGWRRVAAARPNAAHRALAGLEAGGRLTAVITQNVDGLHQQAGSRRVIDLHGRLDRVECLDCARVRPRDEHQGELEAANPGWAEGAAVSGIAPDGDADLAGTDYRDFRVPACRACGGVLKPAVVFFGEGVPRERVSAALAQVSRAGLLLVAGSSLMVWSGYRFVRAAREAGVPVVLAGLGLTRAEGEAAGRVTGDCRETLPALLRRLGGTGRA
ncbi:NAD-dependent protein deacetylase [Sediminicurvatus halobius]|uniref:protein acetyllysine N-acetyltransferase n=1 Tax=Sediminicurvatus halobius TaxID=2182432 RepID=A0A2U2MX13_9GAMM|nr:NAD-dependent protein deacetylase [Spiribacter halobius]PWG61403.1 NAD-dependent protein deacetylase [Spiribacter halobius]UEX78538.1 NAD-dependent protein deacetylase [Spiribacter halobius]